MKLSKSTRYIWVLLGLFVIALAIFAWVLLRPSGFPLTRQGPYHMGKRTFDLVDASRDDRSVRITVWYPAVPSEGANNDALQVGDSLAPDMSGAPYPLLLSSTQTAGQLAPYMISHGYTWVSIDRIGPYRKMDNRMIDHPLDIHFALDQVASTPPEGLEGMIDSNNAGVIGYSFDGYNTLALSGARIDPAYYKAQCPTPDAISAKVIAVWSAFDCAPASTWEEFAAHAGEAITASEDGLWQPMTDERIRAVMPLAAEGWWLFGERGLAAVDRPVLMLVATEDELYPENVLIYEHLGTSDKAFISFIGRDHMMIIDEDQAIAQMAHFALAFFGYHLQGHTDLMEYFSEDFVSRHEDLSWGPYSGE